MPIVKGIGSVFFHVVRAVGVYLLVWWNFSLISNYWIGRFFLSGTLLTFIICSILAIAIILLGQWGLQEIDPERPNLPLQDRVTDSLVSLWCWVFRIEAKSFNNGTSTGRLLIGFGTIGLLGLTMLYVNNYDGIFFYVVCNNCLRLG